MEEARVKMNNVEVIATLRQRMSQADAQKVMTAFNNMFEGCDRATARRRLAHAIIDAYSTIGDMDVKILLKQLQKKYMSGARSIDGEDVACNDFVAWMSELAFGTK
jgi:hypothetical protein